MPPFGDVPDLFLILKRTGQKGSGCFSGQEGKSLISLELCHVLAADLTGLQMTQADVTGGALHHQDIVTAAAAVLALPCKAWSLLGTAWVLPSAVLLWPGVGSAGSKLGLGDPC